MSQRISTQGFLRNLGATDREISEIPIEQLNAWEKVLNQDPLDQDIIKNFLQTKIFVIAKKLSEPKTLGQSILALFHVDPNESYLKASLGILTELQSMMGYDPSQAMKNLETELRKRIKG